VYLYASQLPVCKESQTLNGPQPNETARSSSSAVAEIVQGLIDVLTKFY